MAGRSIATRLRAELDTIRQELVQEMLALESGQLDWAPKGDMKSYRELLVEIGSSETISLHWITERALLGWDEADAIVRSSADEAGSMREALGKIRKKTLDYLAACDDAALLAPISLPVEWRSSFGGANAVEPEELIREIARHEYYHLGQIVSYRWIQGHNPYKKGKTA